MSKKILLISLLIILLFGSIITYAVVNKVVFYREKQEPSDNLADYYIQKARLNSNFGFYQEAIENYEFAENQEGFESYSKIVQQEKTNVNLSLQNNVSAKLDDLKVYYEDMGDIEFSIGNYEEAITNYQEALNYVKFEEDKNRINLRISKSYDLEENYEKSAENYILMINNAEEAWLRYRLAREFWEVVQEDNKVNENLEKFEKQLAENQEDKTAMNLLLFYYNVMDFNENQATSLCNQLLVYDPEDKVLLYTLAEIYNKGGKYDKAKDVYLKLIQIDPEDSENYYSHLVDNYYLSGNYEEAITWQKDLISNLGEKENYYFKLAAIYKESGNYPMAEETFENMYSLALTSYKKYQAKQNIAEMYVEIGDKEKAIKIYQDLAENSESQELRAIASSRIREID